MRRVFRFNRIMLQTSVVLAALINSTATYSASQTVTLITGDRVTLDSSAGNAVRVERRKGRESMRFTTQALTPKQGQPQVYVIPQDAEPLIAAGSLDRELFNITALQQVSRDGAVPLVVTYAAQTRTLAAAGVTVAGAAVGRQLRSINAVALSAADSQAGQLWDTLNASRAATARANAPLALNGAIRKIWLDRPLKLLLDRSVPQIGAPAAWAMGYQGDGVVVAVIDSGVDLNHPDLAGKVAVQRNFTFEPDTDLVGHGTHVAATIAGSGAASGGKYRGVAPNATLISAKACYVNQCLTSDMVAAMEWAVMEEGAKIVNVSIGNFDTPDIDPVEQAVNELTENYGALFVIAAGNYGPDTVNSPSTADAALSVAAVDRADRIAVFSSGGPRFDGAIKPEIAGPGVGIVAARAAGTNIGEPLDTYYTALDGTSMATPHVAGAAALLSQRHPEWGPHQLKAVLIGTAKRNAAASTHEQGAGRVDVEAAFALALRAEPATLGLPEVLWPHDDDVPVTRTISYINEGAEPLALTLRAEGSGPQGAALPAGFITLSSSTLTIEAGATATVDVTIDTRGNAPDGLYSGALVADVSGRTLTLPWSIEREVESYDILVSHIDTTGQPARNYSTYFAAADSLAIYAASSARDRATVRLPLGRYAVFSDISEESTVTEVHHSTFTVDGAASLTLDARNATKVDIQSPGPKTFGGFLSLAQTENFDRYSFATFIGADQLGNTSLATLTMGEHSESFSSVLHARWFSADNGSEQSVYSGAWVARGALVTGSLTMLPRQLSLVNMTYASSSQGITSGFSGTTPRIPESGILIFTQQELALPSRRKEYFYSSDDSVRWLAMSSTDLFADEYALFQSSPMHLLPGHRYGVRWNEPPFSPVLTADPFGDSITVWANRSEDFLRFGIPMYGDRGGHSGFLGNTLYELYADGVKIGEAEGFAEFEVPPERKTYRLVARGSQSLFELSPNVTAAWTFTSESNTALLPIELPFLSLRLDPKLNVQGRAYKGVPYAIPISVRQLTHKGDVALKSLSVEASFDDGKTWQRTLVKRNGLKWTALLKHPEDAQYVSLRTVASDLAGNMLEQTIVRAYGLTDAPKQ